MRPEFLSLNRKLEIWQKNLVFTDIKKLSTNTIRQNTKWWNGKNHKVLVDI